ncbi:MAG: N-acetylmuramoyl-L-alanine amidase [Candidatus Eremiobacteraeota bacterium]|nr:N-acetylmuramoyl-L-alanine amidase [Candidatus Eremiobacteraeota bacterium]
MKLYFKIPGDFIRKPVILCILPMILFFILTQIPYGSYGTRIQSSLKSAPFQPLTVTGSGFVRNKNGKAILMCQSGSARKKIKIDKSRMRDLKAWKPQIVAYSRRHYMQNTSVLNPRVIVLHYTAMSGFPWNLVNSKRSAGETPGLASHYVIDGEKIWRILPDNVRSRGCYGINHVAINIEMVALNANHLQKKKKTMKTCAYLVKYLMNRYGIPLSKVYSHQDVAYMDRKRTPEVLDYVNGSPYGKVDPGEKNMRHIKLMIKKMKNFNVYE